MSTALPPGPVETAPPVTLPAAALRPVPTPGALLDRLGRLSMYRTTTLALAAVVVAALVAALVGAISLAPAALLGSAAVLLASAWLVGRIGARVFGARQHTESAVITALILLLILPPATSGAGLAVLAVAGSVAAASKYLLAYRGRHLFNPAAVGAAYLSLTSLPGATWWVAARPLLPVVAVAGLWVLLRAAKLPVALMFLAVAGPIVAGRAMATGDGLGSAVWTAMSSWPLVFLAAFMLSEPLTLPPRRWAQLGLAALVGLLIAVPISIGPVAMTPEIGLLVGNLLAFALTRRTGIELTVRGWRRLSAGSVELVLAPRRPLPARAGQYLELTVPHRADARGARRMFSLVGDPQRDGVVRLGIRVPERCSSYKTALLQLPQGARLTATGFGGDFLLPRDPALPLLLVAGGIGITPFVGQLAAAAARDAVLVYGVGSVPVEPGSVLGRPGEIPFRDELLATAIPVVLVCPHRPIDLPTDWRHVPAAVLSTDVLAAAAPDGARRLAMVSGPPAMVRAAAAGLRSLGVRRVRMDVFAGS